MAKIIKLFLLTTAVIVVLVCVTGCVSPFYGTARIEKGWNMDVGVAATSFSSPQDDWNYCVGLRGDCEVGYCFNKYILLGGRAGGGLGYSIPGGQEPPTSWSGPFPVLDGSVVVQGAYPFKAITPALRVEVGSSLAVTPLVGFGKKEWLTIGGRFWTVFGAEGVVPDVFVTVHPSKNWSVFAGVNIITIFTEPYPVASIGVGYKLLK